MARHEGLCTKHGGGKDAVLTCSSLCFSCFSCCSRRHTSHSLWQGVKLCAPTRRHTLQFLRSRRSLEVAHPRRLKLSVSIVLTLPDIMRRHSCPILCDVILPTLKGWGALKCTIYGCGSKKQSAKGLCGKHGRGSCIVQSCTHIVHAHGRCRMHSKKKYIDKR